jgi:hypothetical protein
MNGVVRLFAAALVVAGMAGGADVAMAKGRGTKGAAAGGAEPKGIHGRIVSVTVDSADATKATIVIRNRKSGQVTVQTDASTVVKVNKQAGTTADLKAGMRVRIRPATGTAKIIRACTKGAAGSGAKHNKGTKAAEKV